MRASDIPIWAAPLTAFAFTLALTWLLLQVRASIALDEPNARSLHSRPVPRTGGLALLAGAGAGALLGPGTAPMALLAVPVALAAVSFLDDLRGLPVAVRFVCHLAALLLPAHYGAGAAIVVAIAIAWMMNACNFMDGSDGMAGGMALAGFGTYGVLAWWAGDATLATVSFSLAAAAAGFLVFNFHPARIFLGDAGSVPLGFLAAVLGLAGWTNGSWSLWIPLVVFSPFIADASLTLARRVFCGERFWQAHHDNYYQRLIRMGWSHRATALAALAAMPGAAALAAAISRESGSTQATWSLVWFGLLGALMLAIGLRWQRR